MADYYSDHYSSTASSNTIDRPRAKVPSGINGAQILYKRATFTTVAGNASSDIIRLFPVRSGWRVLELLLSHPADGTTALSGNFGLYEPSLLTGVNGNYAGQLQGGSNVAIGIFSTSIEAPTNDLTAAFARSDILNSTFVDDGQGNITTYHPGGLIWQQVNYAITSAGTRWLYDPGLVWDVAISLNVVTGAVDPGEYVLEMYYTENK